MNARALLKIPHLSLFIIIIFNEKINKISFHIGKILLPYLGSKNGLGSMENLILD